MAYLDVLGRGQHEVGLERVVGVFDLARRCLAVARVGGAGGGACRFRGRFERVGVAVHLVEKDLEVLAHRLEQYHADARVVLIAQPCLDTLALIKAEADRQRARVAKTLQLVETLLQDFERFETRLQVGAPILKLDRLVEIGGDIGEQLTVADVRPGPAGQRAAEQRHRQHEGALAQALPRAAGLAAHQVAVGKDDAGEEILEEEAVARGDAGALHGIAGKPEALFDTALCIAAGLAFLQRAGEVEAAEDRLELEGVVFEQGGDEGSQRGLERREFEWKGEQTRWHAAAPGERHLHHAHLAKALVKRFEVAVEAGDCVVAAIGLERQRGAPDAIAFAAVGVLEELVEAGDEVGLGEYQIDRRVHLEPLGELLNALAQLLGEVDRELGRIASKLGDACRDDDAVDRRAGPVTAQQIQEAQPFAAVLFVDGVASSGVEEDAFGGEEPVAVTGAADALDHRAFLVGERKGQAGTQHGGALARRGVADQHVPGQLVQCCATRLLTQTRTANGLDGSIQALAQRGHLGLAGGDRAGLDSGGLLVEHRVEPFGGKPGLPATPQPDAQPHHHDDAAGERGPVEREFERVRTEEEKGHERGDANE